MFTWLDGHYHMNSSIVLLFLRIYFRINIILIRFLYFIDKNRFNIFHGIMLVHKKKLLFCCLIIWKKVNSKHLLLLGINTLYRMGLSPLAFFCYFCLIGKFIILT